MSGGHPLVLAGFMGTGKSTVGRLLAARLGVPFVDLDQRVESRQGRSVSEIFAREGEGAFRAAETRALEEALALPERSVIALGGGTLHQAENRALLEEAGVRPWVLHLDDQARGERLELLRREGGRPLLPRYEALYRARAPGYREWGEEIDVSGLSPSEAVTLLLARLGEGR